MEKEKRYLRIYEQVREDIIKGTYPKGSKLPSKRVMADAMGMSVITVEHAYELLSEEGYIVPRQKSGYYVSFDDSDIYTGVEKALAPAIKERPREISEQNNSNEPVFSYSIYAKTVRKVLTEFEEYLMQKSPKSGMFELRSAIAWYLLRSRRLKVSPDQIIIGAGAEYLYGLIVQTFGRDVLYGVESPSYQKIAKVYSAGGARLEMLGLEMME